mmetsp:Transcript_14/g.73  ORF Transcript_14/g.73 Transcript_14/m.73 type:complete len:438 (+) Transcript_14:110-1423(+)
MNSLLYTALGFFRPRRSIVHRRHSNQPSFTLLVAEGTHDLLATLGLTLGRGRLRHEALGLGSPLLRGFGRHHGGDRSVVALRRRLRQSRLLSLGLGPALLAGVGLLGGERGEGDVVARSFSRGGDRLLLRLGLRAALLAGVRDLLLGEVDEGDLVIRLSLRGGGDGHGSLLSLGLGAALLAGVRELLGLGRGLVLLDGALGKEGHGLLGKHEEQRDVVGGARGHRRESLLSLGLGPALLARVRENLLLELVQRHVVRVAGFASLALLLLDVKRGLAGLGAVLDGNGRGLDGARDFGDELREAAGDDRRELARLAREAFARRLELGRGGRDRLLIALQSADGPLAFVVAAAASAVRSLDDVHLRLPELNLELLGDLRVNLDLPLLAGDLDEGVLGGNGWQTDFVQGFVRLGKRRHLEVVGVLAHVVGGVSLEHDATGE